MLAAEVKIWPAQCTAIDRDARGKPYMADARFRDYFFLIMIFKKNIYSSDATHSDTHHQMSGKLCLVGMPQNQSQLV